MKMRSQLVFVNAFFVFCLECSWKETKKEALADSYDVLVG